MRNPHINRRLIQSGAVWMASIFAGVGAAKVGMRQFEKFCPKIKEMIDITRVTASMMKDEDVTYDDDDEDDDD